MKFIAFLFFFFLTTLFSVESLHISSSLSHTVLIEEAKILQDTRHLSAGEAYALLQENRFDTLPLHVRSLGVNQNTYWVALKSKNTSSDKAFVEFQYDQLEQIECFVYEDGKNVYLAPLDNREMKKLFARFALLKSQEPVTYLFKITSGRPIIIGMHIGTQFELDVERLKSIIFVTLFTGCLFLLLFFDLMLYFIFKLKEYLFYGIYLASFWFFIIYIHNYIFLIMPDYFWFNTVIKIISVQGFHVAFLLFTIYFLDMHRLSMAIVKMTYVLCFIAVITFLFLGMQNSLQTIAFVAGILIPLYCLVLGLVAMYHKMLLARWYLLGLLGFYMSVFLFWSMELGFIDVLCIGKNVLLLGIMWEMVVFTGMLLWKIKIIKNEYSSMKSHVLEVEKERLYQSRYSSIGRTIGNIAHQWKQPLNALGSVLTHMKGSLILEPRIKKKKLIESLDISFQILKHLSETIDTFYRFLLKSYTAKSQFYVSDELESIQKMLEYTLENSKIALRVHCVTHSLLQGNPNEFIQVILNILLNAKDQFDAIDYTTALIDIHLSEMNAMCIVSIQDNAGGIAIEPVERIFEYNVTCKQNSAGVGLFICKDIIENRFKGKITVENKNKGACFTITIPLFHAQSPQI